MSQHPLFAIQADMYSSALTHTDRPLQPDSSSDEWKEHFLRVYMTDAHPDLHRPDAVAFRIMALCRAITSIMGTVLPVTDAIIIAVHALTSDFGFPHAIYRAVRDTKTERNLMPCWRSFVRLVPEGVKIHYAFIQSAMLTEQWGEAADIINAMFELGWESHPEEAKAMIKWAVATYRPGQLDVYVQLHLLARMHCSPDDVRWPELEAKIEHEESVYRYCDMIDIDQACLDLPEPVATRS